jgi:protein-serine/threonine kinase
MDEEDEEGNPTDQDKAEKDEAENIMDQELDMDRRGTFVGTLNFMAPEMIRHSAASMATDLWCFGCIIYKIMTGNVPFTGTNPDIVF